MGIAQFTTAGGQHSENCLVCLTNLGDCIVLSIPELRRQLNAAVIRREDIKYGLTILCPFYIMRFAVFYVVHITYTSQIFPFTVMNNVGLFFFFSDVIKLFC